MAHAAVATPTQLAVIRLLPILQPLAQAVSLAPFAEANAALSPVLSAGSPSPACHVLAPAVAAACTAGLRALAGALEGGAPEPPPAAVGSLSDLCVALKFWSAACIRDDPASAECTFKRTVPVAGAPRGAPACSCTCLPALAHAQCICNAPPPQAPAHKPLTTHAAGCHPASRHGLAQVVQPMHHYRVRCTPTEHGHALRGSGAWTH